MAEALRFAAAAKTLEGVRFRLHGRNPKTGLDCVGLVAASLQAIGRIVHWPSGYTLRNRSVERWLGHVEANSFLDAKGPTQPGDLLLLRPSVVQFHLAIIDAPSTIIHAHAMLRRVVRQPLSDELPIIRQWRLTPSIRRS